MPSYMPWTNSVFHSLLYVVGNMSRQTNELKRFQSNESAMLTLADKILCQNSMYHFQTMIEKTFPSYMDCERVVVVMVQRFKKFIYRICHDEHTGEDYITKHDFDQGLAGSVAISGHSVMQGNVQKDYRFVATIDDPYFNERVHKPANEIVAVPVFATDDWSQPEGEDTRRPRAIVILINKVPCPATL